MNKKTAKVNEAKSHFFEKIKKTEKPLATFIQKKKREIRNEKRESTMQRNRTIRDHHHKQLHADKIDNLAKLTNSKKKGRRKEAGRENTNRPTNQTS